MSVFTSKVHYSARLKRFIVTYHKFENTLLDCQCCSRKITCIHKGMAIWYLTQCNMISGNPLHELPEETEHSHSDSDREWTENLYPPRDEKALIIMMNYIRYHQSYKKQNLKEHNTFNKKHVPTNLVPIIENCHICHLELSKPIKVSENVVTVTFQGIYKDYNSYLKQCKLCKHYYLYQTTILGIHNFDDKLFLGIDICLYLREHIQNYNSVTSFVNSYNSMFECNVNYQKVLNGYLLFDVLCQSDKEFYCYICGHHPWILVMDLNRKIAFKMSANKINADNENDEVIDLDELNMDKLNS